MCECVCVCVCVCVCECVCVCVCVCVVVYMSARRITQEHTCYMYTIQHNAHGKLKHPCPTLIVLVIIKFVQI